MFEPMTARPVTPICAVPVFASDELMSSPLRLENIGSLRSHCGTADMDPPWVIGFPQLRRSQRLNSRCNSVSHGTASATVGTHKTAAAVRYAAAESTRL